MKSPSSSKKENTASRLKKENVSLARGCERRLPLDANASRERNSRARDYFIDEKDDMKHTHRLLYVILAVMMVFSFKRV